MSYSVCGQVLFDFQFGSLYGRYKSYETGSTLRVGWLVVLGLKAL